MKYKNWYKNIYTLSKNCVKIRISTSDIEMCMSEINISSIISLEMTNLCIKYGSLYKMYLNEMSKKWQYMS